MILRTLLVVLIWLVGQTAVFAADEDIRFTIALFEDGHPLVTFQLKDSAQMTVTTYEAGKPNENTITLEAAAQKQVLDAFKDNRLLDKQYATEKKDDLAWTIEFTLDGKTTSKRYFTKADLVKVWAETEAAIDKLMEKGDEKGAELLEYKSVGIIPLLHGVTRQTPLGREK